MSRRSGSVRRLAATAACFAAFLATGCQPTPGSSLKPESDPIAGVDLGTYDHYLVQLAKGLGVTNPPEVEIVTWVTNSEANLIIGKCLEDKGLAVEYDASGVEYVGGEPPPGNTPENLAIYTCSAMYPSKLLSIDLTSEDTLRTWYAYYRDELLSCLAENGYPVEDLPTFETFSEPALTSRWSPWQVLIDHGLTTEEQIELQELCPPFDPTRG